MVDNSTASGPYVPDIRRALPSFIEKLAAPTASGRRNEIALITLGNRPTILADYSLEAAPLIKATERLWQDSFPGGQYLLNGIIEASQGFKRREAERPVIVAIISEGPELSSRHPDQVLEPLRDVGAAFHVVTLGLPSARIDDDSRFRDEFVDRGPRETGGTHSQLLASSALPGKLDQLAEVLTKTYRVTYARPDSLIPPERITVSAKSGDVTAHGTPVKESKARQ
jgi:hypothetical protein